MKDERQTEIKIHNVNESTKRLVKQAAAAAGLTLNDYCVNVLATAARATLTAAQTETAQTETEQ